MEVIVPYIGSKNQKKLKMVVLKVKSGAKTADITENGRTIKNMDLLFKFTEIMIVMKGDGCKIYDMEMVSFTFNKLINFKF